MCFVLIYSCASMLRVVCNRARNLAKQFHFNQRFAVKTQGKSSVKMMILVSGVFIVCYGIFMRCNFVLMFGSLSCNDFQYKVPLQVMNSAINPVAYAFLKRDIKKEFERVIFKKRH